MEANSLLNPRESLPLPMCICLISPNMLDVNLIFSHRNAKGSRSFPTERLYSRSIPKLGKYRLLFIIPLVMSGLVFVLTMINNYNTARYYHSKNESFASILCATFFFEFPLSLWMMQSSDYSIFVLEIFKSNPKTKVAPGKELQEVAQ
jgi:hypothetical protein